MTRKEICLVCLESWLGGFREPLSEKYLIDELRKTVEGGSCIFTIKKQWCRCAYRLELALAETA
jgi:hypothetical protein